MTATSTNVGSGDPPTGNARSGGGLFSPALFGRTWRAQRTRVLLVCIALAVWSFLMPVIYATFGRQFATLLDTGIIPQPLLNLLGSDALSLTGAIALGWVHPIGTGLLVMLPVGLGTVMIAGERQRGTLEVLLSRPLSRRSLFLTHLAALVLLSAIQIVAALAGTILGAAAYGLVGDLDAGNLAFLAFNTWLFAVALASIALAVSASFDRLGVPVGIAIGGLLLGYLLEVLGTMWPDAAFLQGYTPFHYLQALDALSGHGHRGDLLVLAGFGLVAIAYGLWRFPRRDLAAPS
jgi:ABC-2 type transport system permease protein